MDYSAYSNRFCKMQWPEYSQIYPNCSHVGFLGVILPQFRDLELHADFI